MGSRFRGKGLKGKESINFAGVDRSGRGFNPRPARRPARMGSGFRGKGFRNEGQAATGEGGV